MVVDDRRTFILLGKKIPFKAVGQIMNTLQEVAILYQSQQLTENISRVNTDGSP